MAKLLRLATSILSPKKKRPSNNKKFWQMFGIFGNYRSYDEALDILYRLHISKEVDVGVLLEAYKTNEEWKENRARTFIEKHGWKKPMLIDERDFMNGQTSSKGL